jgi:glutamate synthase domain-containing protein 3
VNQAVSIDIQGHAGYYCAGMNQKACITVHGNVGVGVAENMMSGMVRSKAALPGGRRHRPWRVCW